MSLFDYRTSADKLQNHNNDSSIDTEDINDDDNYPYGRDIEDIKDTNDSTLYNDENSEENEDEEENSTLPLYHYTVILTNGTEYDIIATSATFTEETLEFYTNDPDEPEDEDCCAEFKLELVVGYARTRAATNNESILFNKIINNQI